MYECTHAHLARGAAVAGIGLEYVGVEHVLDATLICYTF